MRGAGSGCGMGTACLRLEIRSAFHSRAGKTGSTTAMAMTEMQGGSHVRANSTRAASLGSGEFELIGHKWFCSAPMSDAFLALAHAEEGLTCFLVPRVAARRGAECDPRHAPEGQDGRPLYRGTTPCLRGFYRTSCGESSDTKSATATLAIDCQRASCDPSANWPRFLLAHRTNLM